MRCAPPIETFDNDYHEVWWNPVAGGDAPKGKLAVPLHEVWLWMGDGSGCWARPGYASYFTAESAYASGWRYVRKIELLDNRRTDGEAPIEMTPDSIVDTVVKSSMEEFEDFFDPISGAGLELLQHERIELSRRIAERAMHHLFSTRLVHGL